MRHIAVTVWILLLFVAIPHAISDDSAADQKTPELPMRDDFDSKLTLPWKIIRPDPTHVSLESHPGKLTITTQYGSIHKEQTTAKNLYFVDVPEGLKDFVATTCVEDFLPEKSWQQAGIMFHNDDDTFIKWVRDYTGQGYPVLNVNWEINLENKGVHSSIKVSKERFWLRTIKRGNVYQCLASEDGKTWTTHFVVPWGDGKLKKVGLVAKNGPSPGDMEAQFDFFELRRPTQEELDDPVYTLRRALWGNWKAVARKVNGKEVAKGPVTQLSIVPGRLTLKEKRGFPCAYTVDLDATPNRITLYPLNLGVGPQLNGLFALDGDALTLCLNPKPGGEAPGTLEPKEGDGSLFMKLEREKVAK